MQTIHVSRTVKEKLKKLLIKKESSEDKNVTYDEIIRDILAGGNNE